MISVAPGFTRKPRESAELSAITARRSRPERVSRYFPAPSSGFGLACAGRSITSTAPATRILPAAPGLEKGVAGAEGEFPFDPPRRRLRGRSRSGSIIERRSFCVSSQAAVL